MRKALFRPDSLERVQAIQEEQRGGKLLLVLASCSDTDWGEPDAQI